MRALKFYREPSSRNKPPPQYFEEWESTSLLRKEKKVKIASDNE